MKLWPAARPVISCEPRTEPPGRVLKVGSCGGPAFGRYLARWLRGWAVCLAIAAIAEVQPAELADSRVLLPVRTAVPGRAAVLVPAWIGRDYSG